MYTYLRWLDKLPNMAPLINTAEWIKAGNSVEEQLVPEEQLFLMQCHIWLKSTGHLKIAEKRSQWIIVVFSGQIAHSFPVSLIFAPPNFGFCVVVLQQ